MLDGMMEVFDRIEVDEMDDFRAVVITRAAIVSRVAIPFRAMQFPDSNGFQCGSGRKRLSAQNMCEGGAQTEHSR